MTLESDPRINPFDNFPEQDDAAVMAELDALFGNPDPEPEPDQTTTTEEDDQ